MFEVRTQLSVEEIIFEREVRAKYISVMKRWREAKIYDMSTMWEYWGILVRAAYQQTRGDPDLLTTDVMAPLIPNVEMQIRSSIDAPSRD